MHPYFLCFVIIVLDVNMMEEEQWAHQSMHVKVKWQLSATMFWWLELSSQVPDKHIYTEASEAYNVILNVIWGPGDLSQLSAWFPGRYTAMG